MCGIIGVIIKKPSQEDFDTIKHVFLESKIRGMHATGLSYVKEYQIHTEKLPVAADQFPFDFPKYLWFPCSCFFHKPNPLRGQDKR